MRPGDRVGDRFTVLAEARGEPDVARYRGADDAGEPVELLILRGRPSGPARAGFLDAHRRAARARDRALVATLAVLDDGVVARAPLEDATLADVRGPIAAGRVAAIGARLLPAVLAAGEAAHGALLPTDIGLDAAGAPVLAVRGRPFARISRDQQRFVAPEAFAGAVPDAAAALYGLGAALYRLATGQDPPPAHSGAAPPPSTLRRGVPPALDAAIARLMSPDPTARAGALPLLQEAATEVGDLRRDVLSDTRDGGREPRRDVPSSLVRRDTGGAFGVPGRRAAVIVPAGALSRLDPAARSALAGWAEVPESVLDTLIERELPLVVARVGDAGDARRQAEAIRASADAPVEVYAPSGGCGRLVLAGLAAAAGAAVATGLWVALGTAWGAVLPPLVLVAFVVFAAASWRQRSAVVRGAELIDDEQQRAAGAPELVRARQRIAALRRQLAAAELPAAAAADLRAGLREVEQQAEALGRAGQVAREALGRVDAHGMRTRLDGLVRTAARDPDAAAERDRVARAVADIEDLEQRDARARADLARLEAALDEVAAGLGPVGGGAGEWSADAIERLVRTTRLAREAVADTAAPARRPVPERE